MTEERMPYGNQAREWEAAAKELRALLDTAGLTQIAAAQELDYSERAIRGFCSGREAVPRAVLYAMRWIVDHKPNTERWLQVHWRAAGLTVTKGDKFEMRQDGDQFRLIVNGVERIAGSLEDLQRRGLVSMHTSYSSDRFRLPTFAPRGSAPLEEHWLARKSADQPLGEAAFAEDRETIEGIAKTTGAQVWRLERCT